MPQPAPPPRPPEPAIHGAARRGDVVELQKLAGAGADINARWDFLQGCGPYFEGLTPLHLAAGSLDGATSDSLRWLLDHGADFRARSSGGVTAAWYAAGEGVSAETGSPRGALDLAARLQLLLDAGLDPNESASNGRSLLVEACSAGDPGRVRLLLERGANPTPRYQAGRERGIPRELFDAIDAPPGMDAFPAEVREQVARSVTEVREQMMRFVTEQSEGLSSFQIPLFGAAESGSAKCVRLLLAAGVSPHTVESDGATALFHATSEDAARALIDAGVDSLAVNTWGRDALQEHLEESAYAEERHRLAAARAIIIAGADLERRDKYGHTRLHGCAFQRAAAAVELLLELGADPLAEQGEGTTPLHAVAWQGESSGEPELNPACDRIIELLAAAGVPADQVDDSGNTPLHQAAAGDWGNPTAIRALLRHGAAVDPVDASGKTPLMLAASRGGIECIRVLLEAGADPAPAVEEARKNLEIWRSIAAHEAGNEALAAGSLADAEVCLELLEEAVRRPPRLGQER